MSVPRLALNYAGASYVPPIANSTQGWAQSSWFAVNAADTGAVCTLAGQSTAPNPTHFTDTFYTNHPGINQGNHWFSYPISTSGGSGDNKAVSTGLVTPRSAALAQLGFCQPFIGTIRHFLSLDQLFKASVVMSSVTTTQAVGTILEPEAVLNFVDFCHLCQRFNMKLIVALYVSDETAGHTHAFYYQALQNISGTAASQTTTQAAQTQTYLNAVTEFLQLIDQYEVCRNVIAAIDLHNEVYYQLGATGGVTGLTHLVSGPYNNAAIRADVQVWMRKLLQTARAASPSFLYGFSENAAFADAATNLRAATLSNQRQAIDLYGDVDFYDLHWYMNNPRGNLAQSALTACLNLPKPWFAGEAADGGNGGVSSVYDGNSFIQVQATDYWLRTLHSYGCLCVCTPSIGSLSNQTGTGSGSPIYEVQTLSAHLQAARQASPII